MIPSNEDDFRFKTILMVVILDKNKPKNKDNLKMKMTVNEMSLNEDGLKKLFNLSM